MRSISKKIVLAFVCSMLVLGAALPALAQDVIPTAITAEEAFDAVQKGIDPDNGLPTETKFVLVDTRTRAEYYWVGTAAMVQKIILKSGNTEVIPDSGKVQIQRNGTSLVYRVGGDYVETPRSSVKSMTIVPIAESVPYQYWDEKTGAMELNKHFAKDIAELAGNTKPALILFCRSGGRTDAANAVAALDASLFSAIYEIDRDLSATNYGGMEGSDYGKTYNGYRGFPERDMSGQAQPAVSWKDAGLPIAIGVKLPKVLGW